MLPRSLRTTTLLSFTVWGAAMAQQPGADVQAGFVHAHCTECHDAAAHKGGLDLTTTASDPVVELWRWLRAAERARSGEMPPADAEQPTDGERAAFVAGVAAHLRAAVGKLAPDPGRVTVRRLGRTQWANCIRDLFGVEVSTASFPVDDLGHGFDTIGDALTFSTLHLEKYLAAAGEVAATVVDAEDPAHPTERRFEAESMALVEGPGIGQDGDAANFYTRATLAQDVPLPRDGIYRLCLVAGADQAGDEPAKMLLRLDGRELDTFEVDRREASAFVLTAPLLGGVRRFEIAFVNDFYDPQHPDPARRDRNLHVDALAVVGPLEARVVPPAQRWLHDAVPARGDDMVRLRAFVRTLLPRVWRRPVAEFEQQRLAEAAAARMRSGAGLATAQRFVLQAALTSPHFLFRGEEGGVDGAPGTVVPLSGPALASRLSFFLWASTPDARLLDLAQRGKLTDAATWRSEIDRMLADPRAESLATEFGGQWLELRNLAERAPDPQRFPDFDESLRTAFRRETELLFLAVLREGRDVRDLIDCDFTHVDGRLAAFYGLPAPPVASAFHRVTLRGDQRERGGVLGHGSVLAITSNPTRTSPVKRGKWILDNLLGQAPPPPPPGNDSLANEAAIDSSRSFREQLASHRDRAACAGCHRRMDALGFALERYDAIGRFRAVDAGGDIDCSGALPNGRKLDGLSSLKRALVEDPAFLVALATKLFVYAVGREARPVDRLRMWRAVDQRAVGGLVRMRDLLEVVAGDVAFRSRVVPPK